MYGPDTYAERPALFADQRTTDRLEVYHWLVDETSSSTALLGLLMISCDCYFYYYFLSAARKMRSTAKHAQRAFDQQQVQHAELIRRLDALDKKLYEVKNSADSIDTKFSWM